MRSGPGDKGGDWNALNCHSLQYHLRRGVADADFSVKVAELVRAVQKRRPGDAETLLAEMKAELEKLPADRRAHLRLELDSDTAN